MSFALHVSVHNIIYDLCIVYNPFLHAKFIQDELSPSSVAFL